MIAIRALVTDWDETISKDTMHLIGQAAYSQDRPFPYPWSHFVDVYLQQYQNFMKHSTKPTSVEEEFQYQHQLRCVELSSLAEAVKLQLFKDVHKERLEEQAQHVETFPGSIEFLKKLTELKIPIYILSVNWSSLIMKRTLELNGIDPKNLHFITNEFEVLKDGRLSGRVISTRDIRTGSDKLQQFKLIKQDLLKQGIQDGVYYIGDSSSDFLTIINADCGVAFGDGSALRKLEQYGIPYDEGIEGTNRCKHVQSWNDLSSLLK